MPDAKSDASGAGSAAEFEAQITARAHPMLSPEERKAAAREKAKLQAQMAAARCREQAAAQIARAKDYDAEAAKFAKGD